MLEIKNEIMGWAGTMRGEMRDVYPGLVWETRRKKALGEISRRLKGITLDLWEMWNYSKD
jgi:hypothetical protein